MSDEEPFPQTRISRRLPVFLLVGLAWCILELQHSAALGKLAFPVTYDDNQYFVDAAGRWEIFGRSGFLALLLDYFRDPPHSPWSSLLAFADYGLFGIRDWAPAAFDTLLIEALIFSAWFVTRQLGDGQATGVVIGLLTIPFTSVALINFRPDMAWGIFAALFISLVAWWSSRNSKLDPRWLGILLGLILLTKPSVAPVSLFVTAVAVFSGILISKRVFGNPVRNAARFWLVAVLVGVAVAFPYYGVAWRQVFDYVYRNVFTQEALLWEMDLPVIDHLTYHWLGIGGKAMLGVWRWIIPASCLSALVLAWHRHDRPALVFALIFTIGFCAAYMAVSLPKHKTIYIGAIVPGLFLCAWVISATYLCSVAKPNTEQSRMLSAPLLVILLIGGAKHRWHRDWIHPGSNEDARETSAVARLAISGVVTQLMDHRSMTHSLFVSGVTPYLNATSIHYYLLQAGLPGIQVTDLNRSDDLDAYAANLRQADAVLVFAPESPALIPKFPSSNPQLQAQVLEMLRSDPTFACTMAIDTYPGALPVDAWLFERIDGMPGDINPDGSRHSFGLDRCTQPRDAGAG